MSWLSYGWWQLATGFGEEKRSEDIWLLLCLTRYPESALPSRWKHQADGRRRFSNLFIVFAFLVSFLGFIQPVRSYWYQISRDVSSLYMSRLSMPSAWCSYYSQPFSWWCCSWRKRRTIECWTWAGGVLVSLEWLSLPGSMTGIFIWHKPLTFHMFITDSSALTGLALGFPICLASGTSLYFSLITHQ